MQGDAHGAGGALEVPCRPLAWAGCPWGWGKLLPGGLPVLATKGEWWTTKGTESTVGDGKKFPSELTGECFFVASPPPKKKKKPKKLKWKHKTSGNPLGRACVVFGGCGSRVVRKEGCFHVPGCGKAAGSSHTAPATETAPDRPDFLPETSWILTARGKGQRVT